MGFAVEEVALGWVSLKVLLLLLLYPRQCQPVNATYSV